MKHCQARHDNEQLKRRSMHLQHMGSRLAQLAEELELGLELDGLPVARTPREKTANLLETARSIYNRRRQRAEFFNDQFFGEPGWDILLDLFISLQIGRKVDVTSITIASAVPPTTALRWLGVVEAEGLVVRHNAVDDKRRSFIELSAKGLAAITGYLISVQPS